MNNKAWIVGGVRTPFVRAFSHFRDLSFYDLGVHVLRALPDRVGVEVSEIEEVYFSTVLLDPRIPNFAREIVFGAEYPKTIYAHSLTNNCISGLVCMAEASQRIALEKASLVLIGGSESMSNPSLVFKRKSSEKFRSLFLSKTFKERLKAISNFRAADFFPQSQSVKEPSTGLTMGEHMEITAKELKISRSEQDKIAFNSHIRAHQATIDERLTKEIISTRGINKDTIIREDTSIEKLSKLKTVFDRSEQGTLTAGNSSSLTDGASCVLISSEDKADKLGLKKLAYIRDYEFSAIEPSDGLLMAPAVSVPRLLKRCGLRLEDFDLIEIHEAFSAQVLANIWAWENGWKEESIGKIDLDKVNVCGGSIAIGHPFSATGGRILLTLANEMERRNAKKALISICAAGATACAVILER